MNTTPRNSQPTCFMARSGARRVMKAMPMPESANEMGRIAGSAPGASFRMAKWATTKVANMPRGTVRLSSVTWSPPFMATMANSNMTSGAAMHRSSSSVLRRVMSYSLSLALFLAPSVVVSGVPVGVPVALAAEAESACFVAVS